MMIGFVEYCIRYSVSSGFSIAESTSYCFVIILNYFFECFIINLIIYLIIIFY